MHDNRQKLFWTLKQARVVGVQVLVSAQYKVYFHARLVDKSAFASVVFSSAPDNGHKALCPLSATRVTTGVPKLR